MAVDPKELAELVARAGISRRAAKKLLKANHKAAAGHGAPSAPQVQVDDL